MYNLYRIIPDSFQNDFYNLNLLKQTWMTDHNRLYFTSVDRVTMTTNCLKWHMNDQLLKSRWRIFNHIHISIWCLLSLSELFNMSYSSFILALPKKRVTCYRGDLGTEKNGEIGSEDGVREKFTNSAFITYKTRIGKTDLHIIFTPFRKMRLTRNEVGEKTYCPPYWYKSVGGQKALQIMHWKCKRYS